MWWEFLVLFMSVAYFSLSVEGRRTKKKVCSEKLEYGIAHCFQPLMSIPIQNYLYLFILGGATLAPFIGKDNLGGIESPNLKLTKPRFKTPLESQIDLDQIKK